MGDHRGTEVAVRAEAELGGNPTWDAMYSSLLWVDVLGSQVHRFTPGPDSDAVLDVPQHVGAAKPRAVGGLVLNLRDGVALVDRDGSRRWLVYWARDGMRGGDAGVDPCGRLWAGTLRYRGAEGGGWLTCVEPDGAARVVLDDVALGGGVAWRPDGRQMIFVDSPSRRIDVLDFDPATGRATDRRPLCEIEPDAGFPAGVCVDSDDCVWVALWDGGAVRRYTPDGRLDRHVPLPVTRPSACAFGGDGLTDLYVTTVRAGLDEAVLAEQELAGSLLVLPDAGNGVAAPAFPG
ncbi:SMP-30/gluconolactonase/LRE family protein [Streptoalloteichus tenebrarius]|uniref:SMP-30/gluconolactonase/LRE family protein n=1 Tax=Streptoalloteichus tenebrarius (strain ATCC 17920 / DSM 40477 / JCM 4838 / CBS 697.72 / NBRC 16177 / NCIMB 11028 / NRRL B-12390 / A12253. 1 / ISP 5477) TaxID=1933 RepID=UPI0020A2354E|nr:SMP-30/gluconolactonase/LRE family protein [Streptoalloteichus tenebrarius]BFF00846.1 SMP-30/gluconolactonase/LRE family protein [Streptoalloteichus tenebrarius]